MKKILIFGDSMVRVLKDFKFGFPVYVKSWGGAKLNRFFSNKILQKVNHELLNSMIVVILHFGTNNVGALNVKTRQTPSIFIEELEFLLNRLHGLPGVSIIVSSILPRPQGDLKSVICETNALIKRACSMYPINVRISFSYKNFLIKSADGYVVNELLFRIGDIHLNSEGRDVLGQILVIAIKHSKFRKISS